MSGKLRIGLLFTSQDRYEAAYVALTTALKGIDIRSVSLTLTWLDGSSESNSTDFFRGYCAADISLKKIGGIRNVGAAYAIQLGMNALTDAGSFDWVGMFESDCYFFPGWLDTALTAASAAGDDGIRVGAVTPICIQNWLTHHNGRYAITEVLPAACCLFRPEAWKLIPPASIAHHFPTKRLEEMWNIPRAHACSHLGWDWIFATAIFHAGGFVSVTTPRTVALNCGVPEADKAVAPGFQYIDTFSEAPPAGLRHNKPNQEGWQNVLQDLHCSSDLALISTETMVDLSRLSVRFEGSWYGREQFAGSWLRWSVADGRLCIENQGSSTIRIRLTGQVILPRADQCVTIANEGVVLAVCGVGQEIFDVPYLLRPGVSVIHWTAVQPSTLCGNDPRELAFAIRPLKS